jgi:transglutaminase-like putative cysteine protease
MLEDLTFLEEGQYTQIDETVRKITEDLRASERSTWGAISGYLAGLRYDDSNKYDIYRSRTASEILNSQYVTGCTDRALAFIVLARAMGIPTRYVETFEKKWIDDEAQRGISGHIFVDILTEKGWRAYEPLSGFAPNNQYVKNGRQYVEFGKGLDFSEVYTKEEGGYSPDPINLKDLLKMDRSKLRSKLAETQNSNL